MPKYGYKEMAENLHCLVQLRCANCLWVDKCMAGGAVSSGQKNWGYWRGKVDTEERATMNGT